MLINRKPNQRNIKQTFDKKSYVELNSIFGILFSQVCRGEYTEILIVLNGI